MKRLLFFVTCLALATGGFAADSKPKKTKTTTPRKSVPDPYPAMIQIPPSTEPPAPSDSDRPPLITTQLDGREIQFIYAANEIGRRQLALAKMAKSKAESEQVKAVAQTIEETQGQENQQVARLATMKGLEVKDTEPTALVDELEALTGPKFEKTWIDRLVQANRDALAAYEAAAKVEDADIKMFAEKMLPLVKTKLSVANRLAGHSPNATTSPQ